MSVKEIICQIKAIPFFIKTGLWIPHEYEDFAVQISDIVVSENGFKIARDYSHLPGERIVKDASVTVSQCKCCGKIEMSWQHGDVPVIKAE